MAHKSFEEDDPFELIAVGPFATEEDCLEEMARTFIDEYARMGWNRQQLLTLFRDSFYQGPHAIYQARGEAFIQQLIAKRVPEDRSVVPTLETCQAGPICNACPAPILPSLPDASHQTDLPKKVAVPHPDAYAKWCGACPVGRSLSQTQCPIRRTKRRFMDWLKARLFRGSRHA